MHPYTLCLYWLVQDTEGWLKLQERLGSSCLLASENTLQGLCMKSTNALQKDAETRRTETLADKGESTGDNKPASGEAGEPPDELGVCYLSCSGITLDSTLSECVDKSTHLKGQYVLQSIP